MTQDRPASARSEPSLPRGLLAALALLAAFASIGVDLYLPSFPTIAADLRVSPSVVQLTLTGFLLGIGVGQFVFGALSDRYGRKGPLVVGSLLCVGASAAAALAPSVGLLVASRVLQGFGGAVGLSPVLCSPLGGALAPAVGWRGVLWAVCAMTVAMAVVVVAVVPETRPRHVRDAARKNPVGFKPLLSRAYFGNAIAGVFGFGALMSYISASPFVHQSVMGLSELGNGLLFSANGICMVASAMTSARLSRTRPAAELLAVGLAVVLGGSAAFAAVALSSTPVVWLAVPLCVVVAGLGFVLGNATALALAAAHAAAGRAAAVTGAAEAAVGALVAPLVGLGGARDAVPLAVVMTACAAIAACGWRLAHARGAGRSGARAAVDD
ncbi:MAG: MFS transporter [Segniliparus sp.]|uniref:MFS transporter n=1 Tax=Segniliparus sp. TaxID=2804064 RepID=UPI003F2B0DBE